MNMAAIKTMFDNATPADDLWPEPQPLVDCTKPEPYPLDALPETVRHAVAEVQGFTKAPVALVASSSLAALSVATQALVDVKRADKLTGPSSLFLLSIADSGERKSTCDGFLTKAIQDYERQKAEEAQPEIARFKADNVAWEAEKAGVTEAIKQAAKRGEDDKAAVGREKLEVLENRKPKPPRIPKLVRGDETPENLAWALAHEWPAAGMMSSEAALILGSHAMGKDTIMRNLGLLNILWDGGTHNIGRRTSESFALYGLRLTVGLQVQEATLRSFFDKSGGLARGTGFFARFLIAWPESTQGLRSFTEAPSFWPALARFNQRLEALLATPVALNEQGGLDPTLLNLSPDAKALWVAFHDNIERELGGGGELHEVRDVASKTADNAARLAALFHALEYGPSGNISAEAFEGASRIAAWHLNEARRFFGELALPEEQADAARLDAWLRDWCRTERANSVSRRTVQMNITPVRLRGRDRLAAALRELTEAGRIREVTSGKRKEILLNPALLERGSA